MLQAPAKRSRNCPHSSSTASATLPIRAGEQEAGDEPIAGGRGLGGRNMRILLVNDYATPKGGAEIQMLGIRKGLGERGHDVRLFARPPGGGSQRTAAHF